MAWTRTAIIAQCITTVAFCTSCGETATPTTHDGGRDGRVIYADQDQADAGPKLDTTKHDLGPMDQHAPDVRGDASADMSPTDGRLEAAVDTGTTPDTTTATCSDGKKNGSETDVDCGGPCKGCLGGKSCQNHSDCEGHVCSPADPSRKCAYAPSCAELYVHYGQRADGRYVIDPNGGDPADRFTVQCDMTTDGGGWTLVGKGRQGWLWQDAGQGKPSDILAITDHDVAYLPAATVRAIAGGTSWDNWANGLRIVRGSGVDDTWFVTPKTAATTAFSWDLLFDGRHGCSSRGRSAVRAHFRRKGGTGTAVFNEADLVDSSRTGQGNDCGRLFTTGWTSHNCLMGFASGSSCTPAATSAECWTATTGTHCIPQSTVWVKNCPTCPHIHYDVAERTSYPGTGNDWLDISGNGQRVNATIDSSCLKVEKRGSVDTFVFPGTDCSRAQFDNSTLNPHGFTAVLWVYSQNPASDTGQGGLYSNRGDTNHINDEAWIWFGKWGADTWYFRVNDGIGSTPCCQDLPGSGTNTFTTNLPLNTWRMVHLGYQTGKTNGWKWGHNGSNAYVGSLAARPYRQSDTTSTIGYGARTSGAYWFGGIASVKIYNRLLSDAELRAEFDRTRGRFGL